MLFSGIHATLAGVVLAMTIPLGSIGEEGTMARARRCIISRIELGPWVAFLVLPVFGFANAGVSLAGASVDTLLGAAVARHRRRTVLRQADRHHELSIFIASRTGIAHLPAGASWRQIYGVALLCGIGFTMSFFIGLLAFADAEHEAMIKLAVLAGSLLSALAGAAVLIRAQSHQPDPQRSFVRVPVEPVEALQGSSPRSAARARDCEQARNGPPRW